jgi:HEAT repeat protein
MRCLRFGLCFWVALLALIALGGQALAKDPVKARTPGTGGLSVLALGTDSSGQWFENTCPGVACEPTAGRALELPEAVRGSLEGSELRVVPIGEGRHVLWLKVPLESGRAYHFILAAPERSNNAATKATVVFEGFTGPEPASAAATTAADLPTLRLELAAKSPDGSRTLLRGWQKEGSSLCGRKALLRAELLDPKSLGFRPASLQHLSVQERQQALRVTAQAGSTAPALKPSVLLSSAPLESAQALVDDDSQTSWSTAPGHDGYGAFVAFRAPEAVTPTGVSLEVAPGHQVPSAFWLLADERLLHVSVPSELSTAERLEVPLPAAPGTSCVAIVLDHTPGLGAEAQVGFSELSLLAAGLEPPLVLIEQLGLDPERSRRAVSLLAQLGQAGVDVLVEHAFALPEAALAPAADVLDRFGCEQSAEAVALLARHPSKESHERAVSRLRMCGKRAARGLLKAFEREGPARERLAPLLAIAAPALAVSAISPRITGSGEARSLMRAALSRASRAQEAHAEVRARLAQADLEPRLTLELLRALATQAPEFMPEAGVAYDRARQLTDFDSRYLLLEAAGPLAAVHARAEADVRQALDAASGPWLRVAAARGLETPERFAQGLQRALGDSHVRVRQAALLALARKQGSFAEQAVLELLATDPWPLVRAAAVEALEGFPESAPAERALLKATGDPSPMVREQVARALVRYPGQQASSLLLAHLESRDESAEVRATSANALAQLCERRAEDPLTRLALDLGDPMLEAERRQLSLAALAALGRLAPKDLQSRIAPLLAKDATRRAAELALRTARNARCKS